MNGLTLLVLPVLLWLAYRMVRATDPWAAEVEREIRDLLAGR